MSNPLLEPIHGVSLQDYAAASSRMAAGVDLKQVSTALGIEPAIFEEASALWIARMQEDASFQISTLFGQYFTQADEHPSLGTLAPERTEQAEVNLARMREDRYFYEELNAARDAAYEYGLDGAQWILDNYGINLTDFQTVAMEWMQIIATEQLTGENPYFKHRREMHAVYAKRFAEDQGGNIADDIEF